MKKYLWMLSAAVVIGALRVNDEIFQVVDVHWSWVNLTGDCYVAVDNFCQSLSTCKHPKSGF